MHNEIYLTTTDNENIAINHYCNNTEKVVIIAHGWFMCKDTKPFVSMSKDFFKHNDIITMDFRGHGKSSGLYTFTAKEVNDLKAVVDFAKSKYSKVLLMGFSLGGASVVIHAGKYNNIDGIIAISAPTNFYKIENHWWKPEAFIPTFKKINFKEKRNIRPGNVFLKKLHPESLVDKITVPTLFLAGAKDPTVMPWHTKFLYDKATCKKDYVLFEKDCHAEDLYLNSKEKFLNICNNWINQI